MARLGGHISLSVIFSLHFHAFWGTEPYVTLLYNTVYLCFFGLCPFFITSLPFQLKTPHPQLRVVSQTHLFSFYFSYFSKSNIAHDCGTLSMTMRQAHMTMG